LPWLRCNEIFCPPTPGILNCSTLAELDTLLAFISTSCRNSLTGVFSFELPRPACNRMGAVGDQQAEENLNKERAMPKIQAGSIKMNYDQQGSGEPLVLIP